MRRLAEGRGHARHRYGAVLLLTLALAVYALHAPETHAARVLELCCAGAVLGFAVGAAATGFSGWYFTSGTDAAQSARVYNSITVLTTTGFGDLTAAARRGRALAVLEMLLGQLYLVTVIATLVGNLRR
jgi:hypothetical protein